MRYVILISLCILIVSGCGGIGRGRMREATGARRELMGTWERHPPEAPDYRHIKIVGPGHFVWVVYEEATGIVVAMGGGTYEFDGKVYIEKLEFGDELIAWELVGREQVFVARLDKGQWHHEGTLSNGVQVREVWTRIE